MIDLGMIKCFLGIEVTQSEDGIFFVNLSLQMMY